MEVARPIIVRIDDGIRMMCADATVWRDVVVYINQTATCNYTPVLLLPWKPSSDDEVSEQLGEFGEEEAVVGEVEVDEEEQGVDVADVEYVGQNVEEDPTVNNVEEGEEDEVEEEEDDDEEEEEHEEQEEQEEEQGEAVVDGAEQVEEDPIPVEIMGEAEFESIFQKVEAPQAGEETPQAGEEAPQAEEEAPEVVDISIEDEFERQRVDAEEPENLVDTDDE